MISSIKLDHVAVALEHLSDAWSRYGGDLPGRFCGGGVGSGFANYQIEYSGGMRLEVLEPANVETNDFLRRFLDRSGPGAHHLTFKVGDIRHAIAELEAAGYRPIGVQVDHPQWKELFLHPKDIPGVVVQLAQSDGDGWLADPPPGFPSRRTPGDAELLRVVHAVADLEGAVTLFSGLLGGEECDRGQGDDDRWVDLAWPGGGVVRLTTPASPSSPLAGWIDGRSGRIHHLAFGTDHPEAVPGASEIVEGMWEVGPAENHGVRLRLTGSHFSMS